MTRPLWLIDLDNTLYDASWRVMGEINRRMTGYVADYLAMPLEQASALRDHYWHRYGATLLGLVRHHGVNAHDFLNKTHPTHDLPEFVRRVRGEAARIAQLRGEKWLLTNAPRAYSDHVLELIGLKNSFDRRISIEDMRVCGQLRPKPSHWMMRQILVQSGRSPHRVVLIDDYQENLRAAHALGMRTARIWVSKTARSNARNSGAPLTIRRPSYVRLQVNSLADLVKNQHRLAG